MDGGLTQRGHGRGGRRQQGISSEETTFSVSSLFISVHEANNTQHQ